MAETLFRLRIFEDMGTIADFMKRTVPRSLRMGKFPYSSILYILLSSVFFMLLYMPFSPTTWFSVKTPRLTVLTALFVVLAVLVLVVSNSAFIKVCRTRTMRTWHYLLWCIAEVVAIGVLYMAETAIFSLGTYPSFHTMALKTFFCISVIMAIPYITIYTFFSRREKTGGDESDDGHKTLKDRMINLYDESGVLKFSVDVDSVLYLKSVGNCVDVFYEKGDDVVPYTMRATMNFLEKSLKGTPLVRCQRSYMVNTRRVRMMQNDNRAIYIIVDNDRAPVIPMSPNYVSSVSDAFRTK